MIEDLLCSENPDVAAWVAAAAPEVEHEARERLAALPVPLTAEADAALWRQRRVLQR